MDLGYNNEIIYFNPNLMQYARDISDNYFIPAARGLGDISNNLFAAYNMYKTNPALIGGILNNSQVSGTQQ